MKDPLKVHLPGSDRLFIVLYVVISRDPILLTPLDDVPLDLSYDPDWEPDEEVARHMHRLFNLRCQFLNRLEDGLAELIRSPPIRALIELVIARPVRLDPSDEESCVRCRGARTYA